MIIFVAFNRMQGEAYFADRALAEAYVRMRGFDVDTITEIILYENIKECAPILKKIEDTADKLAHLKQQQDTFNKIIEDYEKKTGDKPNETP